MAAYTCIYKVSGHFAAACIEGGEKKFISDRPQKDVSVAMQTAKVYAENHKIPCKKNPKTLDNPIMTVIQKEGLWYPGHMNSEKTTLMEAYQGSPIGGPFEVALTISFMISNARQWAWVPELGMCLGDIANVNLMRE